MEAAENDQNNIEKSFADQKLLSKNAQKTLLKQQRYETKKAERKAQAKEQKRKEAETKQKEWEETLARSTEEEREKLIESRKSLRRENGEEVGGEEGEDRAADESQRERSKHRRGSGVRSSHDRIRDPQPRSTDYVLLCGEWKKHLSLSSLVDWMQKRDGNPAAEAPRFNKWIIEKKNRSYLEAMEDRKENLVYLTADSETVLIELENLYRWCTICPSSHLFICSFDHLHIKFNVCFLSSHDVDLHEGALVLTVNQVIELLVKLLETKDWKTSFFLVIPQRKRCEADSEVNKREEENEKSAEREDLPTSENHVLKLLLIAI